MFENIATDRAVNIGKVYYRTNLLDSTLIAVDEDGDVIRHVVYDEWGNPESDTYVDQDYYGIDNINNYTGYMYDEVLGLYFAQNRFYDPQTKRFTQEDPIKDGENWYVYVGANPLTNVDPVGLKEIPLRSNVQALGGIIKNWNRVKEEAHVVLFGRDKYYTAKYGDDEAKSVNGKMYVLEDKFEDYFITENPYKADKDMNQFTKLGSPFTRNASVSTDAHIKLIQQHLQNFVNAGQTASDPYGMGQGNSDAILDKVYNADGSIYYEITTKYFTINECFRGNEKTSIAQSALYERFGFSSFEYIVEGNNPESLGKSIVDNAIISAITPGIAAGLGLGKLAGPKAAIAGIVLSTAVGVIGGAIMALPENYETKVFVAEYRINKNKSYVYTTSMTNEISFNVPAKTRTYKLLQAQSEIYSGEYAIKNNQTYISTKANQVKSITQ